MTGIIVRVRRLLTLGYTRQTVLATPRRRHISMTNQPRRAEAGTQTLIDITQAEQSRRPANEGAALSVGPPTTWTMQG